MSWLTRILALGRITEQAGARPSPATDPPSFASPPSSLAEPPGSCGGPSFASPPSSLAEPPGGVAGSLQVRHVDAGSCNGCEIEIAGAFGPVYDAERFGARLVASPRHADALMVTGVVTRNMAEPLRNTLEATPQPRKVIACGDCALNRGVFAQAYATVGAVGEVVPVDVEVPGCPPTPDQILAALRSVTGK